VKSCRLERQFAVEGTKYWRRLNPELIDQLNHFKSFKSILSTLNLDLVSESSKAEIRMVYPHSTLINAPWSWQ
jgi:hypothetical protein